VRKKEDSGEVTNFRGTELKAVVNACRRHFVVASIFSLAINLLYLASPLYMLQVYDRVIMSSSVTTLAMLTLILLACLAVLTALDSLRALILTRASVLLDRLLVGRIMKAGITGAEGSGTRSQPLRDFDVVRQFVTGPSIHALFDLPWAPIYIAMIFMLHPALGLFAFLCALALVALALLNERLVQPPLHESNEAASKAYSFAEMSLRNAEVVQAMGMADRLVDRWHKERGRMMDRQVTASDRAAKMTSIIKFLRLSMQSLILGLGAYLAISHSVSVGSMFVASLLLGRSLQPVEQIVGSWRNFVSARDSFYRLRGIIESTSIAEEKLELPRPQGHIAVEDVTYGLPNTTKAILHHVTFSIDAGEVLGVIGPSGAGKSTLIRHLIGLLQPSAGTVRLDGSDVSSWPRTSLGQHVGYLPQDVELFSDSVAANISRFQSGCDDAVIEAAQMAGVHELILRLPDGYDTKLGENGLVLSGGYRQRIGLARAVFGSPSVVVLDEPSSNLDTEGDAALANCVASLKRKKSTVILVSHRPATMAIVDKVLLLINGTVASFGTRPDVLTPANPFGAVTPAIVRNRGYD
jgi:ATP-binding cassette subfamily C protein